MSVNLHVKDDHQLLGADNSSRSFSAGRLTIGRGPENDWVLPDPERIISKQHCLVEEADGVCSLTDTSSNGVFVNSADKPVGRGNKVVLADGDHFRIGHFRIDVTIADQRVRAPLPESADADDPFGSSGLAETRGEKAFADIFGTPGTAAEPSSGRADFGAFDEPFDDDSEPHGGAFDDAGAGADSGSPDQEFFRPPDPITEPLEGVEIPDDWDSEWASDPAGGAEVPPAASPPAPSATPAAGVFVLEEIVPVPDPSRTAEAARPTQSQPAPAQVPATPPAPQPPGDALFGTGPAQAAGRRMMQAFLEGAALGDLAIPDEKAEETMRLLGALFRETVKGLREVLAARSSIKSEFRLTQTMIQPVENNPLKFSLGDDDALTALLTKTGKGYLPPQRALNEAFADVKAHQVAVMVGMQAALTGLLARFDPRALERRLNQESGSVGGLLRNKKSKYWDEFAALYATIAAEAEDDFQSVFGREFGKAYETQSRKQTGRN